MSNEEKCPLCDGQNHCNSSSNQPCWCFNEHFPKAIFEKLTPDQIKKACICKTCLEQFRTE